MTYSELTAMIKAYLEVDETDFNTYLPQFIKAAEEDVYRKVQLPDLRKNVTTNFTASSQYLATPTDYLSPYSLAVTDSGSQYFLENKDVNFMREAFPDYTTEGRPRYFAQFDDDTFILAPTPDSAYVAELHYFYKPSSLVDAGASGTTWLSTNAENALLYGSLRHGYAFLKGDQDVHQQYEAMFQSSVDALKIITEGRTPKDTWRTPDRTLIT